MDDLEGPGLRFLPQWTEGVSAPTVGPSLVVKGRRRSPDSSALEEVAPTQNPCAIPGPFPAPR